VAEGKADFIGWLDELDEEVARRGRDSALAALLLSGLAPGCQGESSRLTNVTRGCFRISSKIFDSRFPVTAHTITETSATTADATPPSRLRPGPELSVKFKEIWPCRSVFSIRASRDRTMASGRLKKNRSFHQFPPACRIRSKCPSSTPYHRGGVP